MQRPLPLITDLATFQGKFVRPAQLARYIGAHRATIYRHIDKGALPVIRRRGLVLIKVQIARQYAGIGSS